MYREFNAFRTKVAVEDEAGSLEKHLLAGEKAEKREKRGENNNGGFTKPTGELRGILGEFSNPGFLFREGILGAV